MIKTPESKISNQIKCSICKVSIKDRHALYQSSLNLGVICKSCRERFAEDDIEMMINLFFGYGDYFGKFEKSEFSLPEVIIEFAKEINAGESTFHAINVKMMHRALTHGITPEELLEELSSYADR